MGTNAISLSISLNQPVYTIPKYHFCSLISKWSMYCVPLELLDKTIAFLCLVTINNYIKDELIAIIRLLQYQITNEYKNVLEKNSYKYINTISLTKRQIEILKYLASGLTEEAIGLSMGISISTIKYHKQNIFRKLDSSCSIEAIVKALKYNVLSLNEINKQCL